MRKLELYLALLPCSHSIALDLLKANRNTYADHRRLSHQHLTSRGMIDDVISDVGTRLLLSDVESGSRDTKKKKECSTIVDLIQISLARPFYDLCRRHHVFLVVVVFEFEFVVCCSGVLGPVSTQLGQCVKIDRRLPGLEWGCLLEKRQLPHGRNSLYLGIEPTRLRQ